MTRSHKQRGWAGFLAHHSLSMVSVAILSIWILAFAHADPKTHLGSFFGNAIADWTGVVVTVLATKYFYEVGSAESRPPRGGRFHSHLAHIVHNHSLTIFLVATGVAWLILYLRMNPESKWGDVAGNIVSEWTQLLGLVLMTKRLMEEKSRESRSRRA